MSDAEEKKPTDSDPAPARDADWGKDMQALPSGQSPEPPDEGSGGTLVETLARWDELAPPELASLARSPHDRQLLQRLQRADEWLQALRVAPGPCPEPERLYDFGRGPGYDPLDADLRAEIADHVRACAECREAVQVLEDSPPLPLHWSLEDPPAPGPAGPFATEEVDPRVLSRPSPWRRWTPLAGAAALLLIASQAGRLGDATWYSAGPHTPPGAAPGAAIYRGESASPLRFPRGRLLAASAGLATLAAGPVFELEPREGAGSYRVVLRRHDGGAFATAESSPEVLRLESTRPELASPSPIGVGHYTWEAWAEVDGLDVPLGSLDFEVRQDAQLSETLRALAAEARAQRLLDAGYRSDARHLARDLPASERMRALIDGRLGN